MGTTGTIQAIKNIPAEQMYGPTVLIVYKQKTPLLRGLMVIYQSFYPNQKGN